MKGKTQEYNFTTRVQTLISSGTSSKNWIQTSEVRPLTLIYVLQVLPCLPRSWLWNYVSALYTWTGRERREMLSTHKLLQLINKSSQQQFHFNLTVTHFSSFSAIELKFNCKGKIIFLSIQHRRKRYWTHSGIWKLLLLWQFWISYIFKISKLSRLFPNRKGWLLCL